MGNGPPKGVTPSELFTRLTTVPRPHTVVDSPRKDPVTGEPCGQYALVPLTETEMMQCRAAAEAYARRMLDDRDKSKTVGDSLGYKDLYFNALYSEMLTRACRDPDPKFKLRLLVFFNSQMLRDALFPDEISILLDQYSQWQVESGPIISSLSESEMEAWVDVLAEGASLIPLAVLSSAARNELLTFMASRLRSSSTDKSSHGSAPDGSTKGYESDKPLPLTPESPPVDAEPEPEVTNEPTETLTP